MIRVDRVTVRGFKSIRALEDFELGDLTVLIGPNGAGKSNFLDLFRMGSDIAEGRLQIFVAERDGPDAMLFGGAKRTDRIDAAFAFGADEYAFSLVPSGNRFVFDREEIQSLRDGATGLRAFGRGHEESRLGETGEGFALYAGDAIEADDAVEFDLRFALSAGDAMAGLRAHHFADTGPTSRLRRAQPLRDNLRLHADGGNLAPFLRRLRERHPRDHRRIVEEVRAAAPFFGDFVYREDAGERVELEWSEADAPSRTLGPRQLSDGTLRFVCLAALLLQPARFQPNPILIDEPELGLHPHAIALLAELLQHASDTRQIVVSTQSADLVSELAPEDIVTVARRNGESIFKRLDPEDLGEWLQDYALGDLLKMYVVGESPGR